MAKEAKKKNEEAWRKALGKHIEELILSKGYVSVYDFWIQAIGEDISRTTLNYIINAKVDVRVATLKKIADALEIEPKELLNFK